MIQCGYPIVAISLMASWIFAGRVGHELITDSKPSKTGVRFTLESWCRIPEPKMRAFWQGIRKVSDLEMTVDNLNRAAAQVAPLFTPLLEKSRVFPRKNAVVRILAG